MIKVDLHVHTRYSSDSNIDIGKLEELCKWRKIIPAITDHNTFEGAVMFRENCIKGEEIRTEEGEIIGLFMTAEIRKGLSIEETVEKIREQGALVYVPHPFDSLRRSAIRRLDFKIDILEVFNSRNIFNSANKEAFEYAKAKKIPMGVGSDAHFLSNVGESHLLMEPFDVESPKEFLKNLRKAEFVTRKTMPYYHLFSFMVKFGKKIKTN